ncbi:MAG: hypothetical protein HOV96_32785 [Nonomuraea sp.]|nr:hypothetical protein [Nonomuraea sp.]NUP63781.1 hypothetical protein [Nonomuraea sp.]NUP82329.1 hypothetical protein [Nonomuraea sp.]
MSLAVVRRILSFEVIGLVSIGMWIGRRRHGVPAGAVAVSYAKEQAFTLGLMTFAMAVETAVVDLLLIANDVPAAVRVPVFVADLYSLLFCLMLAAASVARPHVVTDGELRIRYGAYFDLRVPREKIAAVRLSRNLNETGMVTVKDGRLSVAVASRTNVTVELTEPITVVRPLGRRAEAVSIRFFADDPATLTSALAPMTRDQAA